MPLINEMINNWSQNGWDEYPADVTALGIEIVESIVVDADADFWIKWRGQFNKKWIVDFFSDQAGGESQKKVWQDRYKTLKAA